MPRLNRFCAAMLLSLAAMPAGAATCGDVVFSTPTLSTFAGLAQSSGLVPQLQTAPLTIFAPTNDALNKISYVTQMLSSNSSSGAPDFPKLQTLVRAHLVSGSHPASEMRGKLTLPTLAGTSLGIDGTDTRTIVLTTASANSVNLSGMRLMAGVHVAGPAIACDNGVVYPIDKALVQ